MRGQTTSNLNGAFRRYGRRRAAAYEPKGGYPTPSQVAFRIAAFLLVALCVALAATFLADVLGA